MLELREIDDHKTLGLLNLSQFSKENQALSKRETEKTGTMYLLREMLGSKAELLRYYTNRKPYLENQDLHLSISHSHDWLAVLVDKRHETGVDIELIRDKVKNVRDKFLSAPEQVMAGQDVEKLITYWAVKESVFKVYGAPEIEFRRDIFILEDKGGDLVAELNRNNRKEIFYLKREVIKDYILVYIDEKGQSA